ncbi:MAG TPA: hypothetical protein VFO73_12500 [Candidatus Limnocylindrales bacterium]|nr:hypothetical protein [Candidatus Limnocylindrales bacterium]
MTTQTTLRSILLIGLLAAITACGGAAAGSTPATGEEISAPAETLAPEVIDEGIPDDAASVPGTALNACEIVTATDIAAATDVDGVEPGEFESTPTTLSPGNSECAYKGDFGRILVDLTPEDGANLYDAAAGAYKDAAPIPGIGDGAFYSADNDRAFVWKGSVAIMFTIFVNGDLDPADVAEKLGKLALAKV